MKTVNADHETPSGPTTSGYLPTDCAVGIVIVFLVLFGVTCVYAELS